MRRFYFVFTLILSVFLLNFSQSQYKKTSLYYKLAEETFGKNRRDIPWDHPIHSSPVFLPDSGLQGRLYVMNSQNIENKNKKIILYLGGSDGSATKYVKGLYYFLNAQKYSVNILALDYPGFGKSLGISSEKNLYKSSEKMYQFILDQGYSAENITVYGYSLGAAVASYLALKNPQVKRLILDRPMVSMVAAVKATVSPPLGSIAAHVAAHKVGRFSKSFALSKRKGSLILTVMDANDHLHKGVLKLKRALGKDFEKSFVFYDKKHPHVDDDPESLQTKEYYAFFEQKNVFADLFL